MDRGPSGPGIFDRMPPSGPSWGPPDRDWDRGQHVGGGHFKETLASPNKKYT